MKFDVLQMVCFYYVYDHTRLYAFGNPLFNAFWAKSTPSVYLSILITQDTLYRAHGGFSITIYSSLTGWFFRI
jgi:hypothetical protein